MEEVAINRFNIRVYFLIEYNERVLVSDELLAGRNCTKFPGGGLEYGEGTLDACKREAMEELGQEIEVLDHLYTTDFFVRSSFYPTDQVVAIYYRARLIEQPKFEIADRQFDFKSGVNGEERRRWIELKTSSIDQMTFPTDRAALQVFLTQRVG